VKHFVKQDFSGGTCHPNFSNDFLQLAQNTIIVKFFRGGISVRVFYAFVLIVGLMMSSTSLSGLAAPPQEEVDQLISGLGWSQEDLQSYLDYYEMTLDDFTTIEELDEFLGTPITDENLEELLSGYGMTRAELDTLLAGFGETVDDYWFIEDLDTSIDFYQNHDEYMKGSEDFLAAMGLTENEVDALFNHFMALDQTALEEQMESVAARLEPYMALDPDAELTEAQIQELTGVWSEMLSLLQINPKYYLVNAAGEKRPVAFSDLLAMETLGEESLLLELYDPAGTLLLDMQLSEDMLTSEFLFEGAGELTNVGDLAGELTKLKHDKLPNTASPFGLNILLGLLMVLSGVFIFIKTRKKAVEKW
jgi:processed acidic surface protein